jgi:hypothetical protein
VGVDGAVGGSWCLVEWHVLEKYTAMANDPVNVCVLVGWLLCKQ